MFQTETPNVTVSRAGTCEAHQSWYSNAAAQISSRVRSAVLAPAAQRNVHGGFAPSAHERMDAVKYDLARAVACGDVTLEQARRFHQRLHQHLMG